MIISGKDLSARMKSGMAEEVKVLTEKYGRAPHLVGMTLQAFRMLRVKARLRRLWV